MLGIFLDSETNGLNSQKHRVIEIALKLVNVQSGELHDSYESVVKQSMEVWERSDPKSLAINGFTLDKLMSGQEEQIVANEIETLLQKHGVKRNKAVFICQNPSFDRIFFSQLIDVDRQEKHNWPYHWLDLASMYWAIALISKGPKPWLTGLSKNRIASIYKLPEEALPHTASNGVNHLIECYKAVVGFPNQGSTG